ncbi:MAG: hypothetical protein AAB402_01765 [Patescibacteria group bacterium]
MQFRYTTRFRRSYQDAPSEVQRAFDRQVGLLVMNLRHPSLRAKKYNVGQNIWQARINRNWRFYFLIEDDTYILIDIMAHRK